MSVQSRDQELKESHGRGMNTLSEDYLLPADKAEMDRLSVQHRMWRLLVGGLYPPSVKDAVEGTFEGSAEPTILDAGCGSAIWSVEMAQMYPKVHVVGVDLARNFQQRPPANFEFILTDMSSGLPRCKNSQGYDLIHARSVVSHMKDPGAFLRHLCAALKPDGILILGDGVGLVFDSNKKQLSPKYPPILSTNLNATCNEDSSWLAGWQQLFLELLGGYQTMETHLENSPFVGMSSFKYFCPVGWEGDLKNGVELGEIMLRNTVQWARACAPAVVASGRYDKETVDAWLDAVEEECGSKKMYVPWVILLARPKDGANVG